MAVGSALSVLCLTIISGAVVVARPCSSDGIYDQDNCVPMTPEREAEIQEIVSKISNFADDLALYHNYFDIRLMKFAIEKHSPNEPEDKNVEIQVTVNDCESIEIAERNAGVSTDLSTKTEADPSTTAVEISPSSHPELIELNLDENGQQLLQVIEDIRGKNKPFIVLLLDNEQIFF